MIVSLLELHVVQLTHFLVTKKGYQTIHIKGIDNEVWLFSMKSKKFSFVRIVQGPIKAEDKASIVQVQEALSKILQLKGPVLDVHLDTKAYDLDMVDNIKSIGIDTQDYAELVIDRYFSGAETLFQPTQDIVGDFQRYRLEVESVLKKRQKSIFLRKGIRDLPPVTMGLAILCILIWMLRMYLTNVYGPDSQIPVGIALGAYYRMFVVANHEYWRFFTAGLVHLNFDHLLMNVLSLINVGIVVEKFYGKAKYSLIIVGSIIMGTMFAHLVPQSIVVLGISGGVYGAFAAMLVILFHTKAIRNPRILRTVGNVVVINILINFLPSVSQVGHLGGFVGGLILGILCLPGKERLLLRNNMAIASLVLVIFLGYQTLTYRPNFELYGGTDAKVIEIYHNAGLTGYARNLLRVVTRFYAEVME